MSPSLVFGAYLAGSSPVHSLDARVKIVLTCALSFAIFFISSWPGLLAAVVLTLLLYACAHIRYTHALSGLKPIMFILLFTVLVHVFSINVSSDLESLSTGSLQLPQYWILWGDFGLTLDGLFRGLYFALRIALLVAFCSLLSFTTSPMELVDAMLLLLSPLRRFRLPTEDIAMIISIALRFISLTATEALTIVRSQKARCANFEQGSPLSRLRAWIPVFIPLFVRLFNRADELACAMDARCWRGRGRTHYHECSLRAYDMGVLVVGLLILAALAILF